MKKTHDQIRSETHGMSNTTKGLLYRVRSYHVLFMCAFLIGTSYGQFIVQPMIIEQPVRAGSTFTQELVLQNWDRDQTKDVDVYLLDLSQEENGGWLPLRPNEDGSFDNYHADLTKLQSCKDWITLDQTQVELLPSQMRTVKMNVRVPLTSKGFYCAAVVASLKPQEDEGVTLRFELVVPILFPVQGYNLPPKVTLKDTGLVYQPVQRFEQGTDSSYVTMHIDNDGGTYSTLNGFAQVRMRLNNNKWRLISSNIRFDEVPIIPGSKLKLRQNLGKLLPNGTYKITSMLYVDGRRANSLEKDIQYVGSSAAGAALEEIILQTSPDLVLIQNEPGRVRSGSLQVYNQSDTPLKVKAYLSDIKHHRGTVIAGHIPGEKLSCADWVQVKPDEFLLREGSKKSLRLTSRMPSLDYRSFYANLQIVATNAEGAFVGRDTMPVIVQNEKIDPIYLIDGKSVSIRDMSEAKHLVSARFENLGTEFILPNVRTRLVHEEDRGKVLLEAELVSEGKSGMMLPVEARSFASVIDFSTIDYGNYVLVTDLYYGAEQNQFQRLQEAIIVYDDNGKKRARVNPYVTASTF